MGDSYLKQKNRKNPANNWGNLQRNIEKILKNSYLPLTENGV